MVPVGKVITPRGSTPVTVRTSVQARRLSIELAAVRDSDRTVRIITIDLKKREVAGIPINHILSKVIGDTNGLILTHTEN
jgi:hypothetical protein